MHGRAGQQQRHLLSLLRPRHEPDLPVRKRRLSHPLLRVHQRVALHPRHQRVQLQRPTAGHGLDAKARPQRHLVRDQQVLQTTQLRLVRNHHHDSATQVRAIPGRSVSRHGRPGGCHDS